MASLFAAPVSTSPSSPVPAQTTDGQASPAAKMEEYLAKIQTYGSKVTAEDVKFGGFSGRVFTGGKEHATEEYWAMEKIYLILLVCKFIPDQIRMAEAVIMAPWNEKAVLVNFFYLVAFGTPNSLSKFISDRYVASWHRGPMPAEPQAAHTKRPQRKSAEEAMRKISYMR